VEYPTESSAHELIEGYGRSYRVTSSQGIADAIADAGEFERRTVEPEWADFDHRAVLREYLDHYRTVRDEHGLF
jgi:hypothetical protein